MKIKKGLALILALAMIITLMPTMAFATTTNSVSRVVTVAADAKMPKTTITLETKDDWDIGTANAQNIRLTLNNATWTEDTVDSVDDVLTVGGTLENGDPIVTTESGQNLKVGFVASGENYIEFSMEAIGNKLDTGAKIELLIKDYAMTSGLEAGDVQIIIDGMDSQISSSTLTVANVVTSTTTSDVTGDVKTFPRGKATGASIEIRETAINSLEYDSIQTIRMTLPGEVTWQDKPFEIGGNLASKEITPKTGDTLAPGEYEFSADRRTVTFCFKVTGADTVRNVMTLTPNIDIARDADEGDIAITLVGMNAVKDDEDVDTITDADDLVIATYGNEAVEITTVEEVPTIVSGYVRDVKDKDFTISVTLEEAMEDSLASERYVDFDLPEEVQISGPIKAKINSTAKTTAPNAIVEIEGSDSNVADIEEDTSGFSFIVPDDGKNDWKTNGANKVTFEIPVTVEAGYTGDITMNITGAKAGVEDTELVVATAETPITVETTTTNVKNGVQTQAVADITITENFAGYVDEDKDLILDVDTLGLSKSMVFEDCDNIEVTEGNLEIGDWDIKNNADGEPQIVIPIKRESTKVSTIKLTGLTMVLNRTLPEGGYDLNVSGLSVVQNGQYNDGDFSDVAATVEDYVVITTPADDAAGVNATFTAGQASYTVDGQTVEMDVAPFIDSNNRMLVPIRYAANAMGVSDSNIQWNGYTQTGTISGAMGVVQVTVGSTNLITSNGTITMDTVAVNTNDRIYVPVRYIANALGASVSWDPATRTATFS